MACQKSYGVSQTQVAKAPAYFDAVKGEWVISYASWDGARIVDPKAERPTVTGLRNGLYILDYVRSEGDRSSTVDEVCLFVYNSPAPVDPTAQRFAPGKEYSMPQPVKEWPPRKQGEICHVLGVPPAPLSPLYDMELQYANEMPIPQAGLLWASLIFDLVDRNGVNPLAAAPNAATVITIHVPAEYTMPDAPAGLCPDAQTVVCNIAPNEAGPQGYQSLQLHAVIAGPGTFTYTVTVGGVQTSSGSFSYPVPGSGAQ